VRACVCACVRACVRACMRACVVWGSSAQLPRALNRLPESPSHRHALQIRSLSSFPLVNRNLRKSILCVICVSSLACPVSLSWIETCENQFYVLFVWVPWRVLKSSSYQGWPFFESLNQFTTVVSWIRLSGAKFINQHWSNSVFRQK